MAALSDAAQQAFSLFDDDSSDEESPVQMNTAPVVVPPPAPAVAAAPVVVEDRSSIEKPASRTHELYAPWEDVRPKYVGPVELVTNCNGIGGMRGYVAAEDLSAGTLLLIEEVFVPWPQDMEQSDPEFFIATLETIFQREDIDHVMKHMAHLHPQRLSDLPMELLEAGHAKYDENLAKLAERHPASGFTCDQLLQAVFAMQCNAFDSGVFLFNAMFNHDCNPNCIKFTPEDVAPGLSEVRLAKSVKKGEALTISYLYPREQTRSRRQRNLREQFGFVCICELCRRGDSILVRPPTQPTEGDEEEGGDDAKTMDEVEEVVFMAENLFKADQSATNAAQVLGIALESLSDALEIVAHDHLVLIRIHKLVADCCDVLLKGKPKQDVPEYAILFLRSSYELLELQRTFLNDDHMDLARTLNDVSQGIQLLLSYDPKVLLEEFPEWTDFRQASIVENQYRQEYRRLKKLYE
ncbi:TPA: hypothetical protein N0F65_000571 [Lagenidium giganteum]|uniref:SET domain-containing protein n=1 Tax=Lagenidium giganteum TaxID=4803 RepID=A0AAV2YZD6_9STRA|nr:TPA: hypothetical protein N0F65_000571 [Lagenidium giganteum]